jgi:hypothetical protein
MNLEDKKPLYEVNIDFDDASLCWKANKISIGNGTYKYVCAKKGIRGNICISKCLPGEEYCRSHLLLFRKGKL